MLTFSSSSSTAFAMPFFCSKTSSKFSFGTLALITDNWGKKKSSYEVLDALVDSKNMLGL
jgi:hypothetical protein